MEQPGPTQTASSTTNTAALQLLLLALKALSQRFVIALYGLRDVLLAGSAFWLALDILPHPDINQLVGLVIYSVFVLTVLMILHRRG